MDNIDKQEAEEGRVMAIMAYIIFLIPIFFGKGNRFVQYHTNQGLILFFGISGLNGDWRGQWHDSHCRMDHGFNYF